MTRVQFLNDLYHHLYGLTQDQAEQHLTYYAEMLADRMEEGMSEEEAVAGMEDVETIARRIMEEEGLPYTPPEQRPVTPPSYPDASRLGGGGFTRAYKAPKRFNWDFYARIVMGVIAICVVVGSVGSLLENHFGSGSNNRTAPTDHAPAAVDRSEVAVAQYAPYAENFEYIDMPYGMGYDYPGVENYYDIDDVGLINIEWASGQVYIQSWGGDEVYVREYAQSELSERTWMECSLDGNVLDIRYRSGISLGNVKGSKWLTVLVPEGLMGEIDISTTSANAGVYGVELDTLRVGSASGEITVGDCYTQTTELTTISGNIYPNALCANQAEISTTSGHVSGDVRCENMDASSISGDISLNLLGNTKELGLHTTSGDIWTSVENSAIQSIDAGSVSGPVSLSLPFDMGFTLDFSTVSGETSFSYDVQRQNGQYVYAGGECRIDVSTVSGDLSIY